MAEDLKVLDDGPKAEMNIDLLRTMKNISNWKLRGHVGIPGFLFKKFMKKMMIY